MVTPAGSVTSSRSDRRLGAACAAAPNPATVMTSVEAEIARMRDEYIDVPSRECCEEGARAQTREHGHRRMAETCAARELQPGPNPRTQVPPSSFYRPVRDWM